MDTLQLDLTLLLPEMDSGDRCIALLTSALENTRGVEQAHIVAENGTAQLCLHFDPDLLSLAAVERLARDTGVSITRRYRHETLPFVGLDAADAAQVLEQELEKLPGMLHASVSYAAGLIFVAYDGEILSRAEIETTIRRLGARVESQEPLPPIERPPAEQPPSARDHAHEETDAGHAPGHDHGSAPTFLPHWMQERWTLLLVAIAGLALTIAWVGETFLALPFGIALMFYLIAYVAGGYDIATHAIPGVLRGSFDTDVLMLAAATGAALLGEWAEGAFLLFLFALGHAGEHYALDRARRAVNGLGELMPRIARVRRGDTVAEIDVEAVVVGDVVIVRPGDRIPVDGRVLEGASAVDQSPITGESVPVAKSPGDEVFAGTVNHDAALEVEATRLAHDNTLSRVLTMVQEAQSGQSKTQRLTERFTRRFVPAVLIVVALVIVVPPLVGWMTLTDAFYRAMLLLVAASPCALAIGAPATVLTGIAQAARHGVLIKGGVHLENLGALVTMAFDKTGTLTEGRFRVADLIPFDGAPEDAPEDALLALAAAVEQHSAHPLAQAVVDAARARNLPLPRPDGMENVAGRGIRSRVDGQPVLIGSLQLFRETGGHTLPPQIVEQAGALEAAGKTVMTISRSGQFVGLIGLADTLRADVRGVLQRLRDLGVARLVMLTGDNPEVARRIAAEVGAAEVGLTDVRARLLPEQKLDAIRDLEAEFGAIGMVGDGVNDAPALATATVGIAMGGAGASMALETADVALMADDLGKLPFAVGLGRAARNVMRQNLAIALGVIVLLLLTSVLGWVRLTGAVILHEGSTLVVVVNALRLLAFRDKSLD